METPREVLLKIKKLLSLSTSSNEHEAALAAAKAQALMDEHKLSESDMDAAVFEKANPVGEAYATESLGAWAYMTWKGVLLHGIAKLNNVQDFLNKAPFKFRLIGRESDRQVVEYLACYLIREVERLGMEDFSKQGFHGNRERWSWVQSFGQGAATAILKRMREEKSAFSSANSSMTAVMVRDDKALANYLAMQYPRRILEQKAKCNLKYGGAVAHGRAAGDSITWSKGVGNGSAQRAIR